MAPRSVRLRLRDILSASDEAEDYLDGADFGSYASSPMRQRAVERCIEIISEAARYIPSEMTSRHADVPWGEIRAIGNHLRHAYQRVDDLVLWRVASRELPVLRAVIVALLADLDREEQQDRE